MHFQGKVFHLGSGKVFILSLPNVVWVFIKSLHGITFGKDSSIAN